MFMKSDESIDHTQHFRYYISLTDIIEMFVMVFYHVIISLFHLIF